MNQPLKRRRPWHDIDHETFVRGTDASTMPPPPFDTWAPPAVLDEAKKLYAETRCQTDPSDALNILSKLVSDKRMETVWDELYKRKRIDDRPTDQFLYPMHMYNASKVTDLRQRSEKLRDHSLNRERFRQAFLLEVEAKRLENNTCDPLLYARWSEQDLGVQLFLWQIYHAALNVKPRFRADAGKLRKIAAQLRRQADLLKALHIESEALEEVAQKCLEEAVSRSLDPKIDNPWNIIRVKGDPNIKTFVVSLSLITERLCGTTLHGSIATITNVLFDHAKLDRRKVIDKLKVKFK
jgi:hypothetical protein